MKKNELIELIMGVLARALPSRARGLMLIMAMISCFICACNRCSSSTDAIAVNSSPTQSAVDAYTIVSRRLRFLEKFRPTGIGITRSVPNNRPAVEVDDELRVHVLRADSPERIYTHTHAGELVTMLYGTIDKDAPPQWRKVAELYRPESPILLLDGAQINAAALGMTKFKRGSPSELLLFPINPLDAGAESRPGSCLNHAASEVRMTRETNDSFVAVTHEEHDQIDDRYALGLRVIRCRNGQGEVLAPIIAGTLHEKTYPEDYDIHVGATGELHVVYEGVRSEAEAKGAQLWHLELDSNGKLVQSKPLANGVSLVYHLELLAAPSGALYVFELYGSRTPTNTISDQLNYRILPLGVMARSKGPALNFVVDSWIQAHAIWFENNEPKHLGPDTIPTGKKP